MRLFPLLLLIATVPSLVSAQEAPASVSSPARIVPDGLFADWNGIEPVAMDPADQPAGEVDLRALSLSHDERALRLRIAFDEVLNLQQDNDLVLYLDTDADPATGQPLPGMGADVTFAFGARSGTVVTEAGTLAIRQADVGIVWAPTHAAREFEVELALDAEVAGQPVFPGDTVVVALATSQGERLPQAKGGVTYVLGSVTLPPYEEPSLAKSPGALRVLSYNVLRDNIFEGAPREAFVRIVQALQPDILAFQEIYVRSGAETAALVTEALGGGPWYSGDAGSDNLLVSRWPVTLERDLGGNSAFVVETPADWDQDLLIVNAHTPCCTNESGRQEETDLFMRFIREVGQGDVSGVDPEAPFLLVGDFNMVGTDGPLRTMLTGDIADNATYGPDFTPDLDGTDLTDALPLHLGVPASFTWYNPGSEFPPGRLDFIVYTDSALDLDNAFVLHTPHLSDDALAAAGLLAMDTPTASDHLPLVADIVRTRATGTEAGTPDEFGVRAPAPNPFVGQTSFRIDMARLGDVTVEVFDVLGRRMARPFAGRLAAGIHHLPFDGSALAPGTYLFRVTTDEGSAGGRMVRGRPAVR
ncbi:MAG: endonuclease/exonuclease/phosphatase family protein [Bacteroidota bacterium]